MSILQRFGRPTDDAWTAKRLAKVLRHRQAHYPISDAYESEHLPGPHWWTSQREHILRWLDEYEGPGAYDRHGRNHDAEHFWNHFQCAPGLLWIAEALGEDPLIITTAAQDAAQYPRPASQCAAIRRRIPWQRIAALAARKP